MDDLARRGRASPSIASARPSDAWRRTRSGVMPSPIRSMARWSSSTAGPPGRPGMCVASSNSSAASAATSAAPNPAGERERLAAVLAARAVRARPAAARSPARRAPGPAGGPSRRARARPRGATRPRRTRPSGPPGPRPGARSRRPCRPRRAARRRRSGGPARRAPAADRRAWTVSMASATARWARRRPTCGHRRLDGVAHERVLELEDQAVVATERAAPRRRARRAASSSSAGTSSAEREDLEVDPLPGDGGRLDRRPRRRGDSWARRAATTSRTLSGTITWSPDPRRPIGRPPGRPPRWPRGAATARRGRRRCRRCASRARPQGP